MKVLFLDVDGVLNNSGTKERQNGFIGIDPEMVNRFNWIIDAHPDIQIVVSSTWRKSGFWLGFGSTTKELFDFLRSKGLKGQFVDITPSIGNRGTEIKTWLDRHPEIDNFIVLDDDTSSFEPDPDLKKSEKPDVDLRPFHVRTFFRKTETEGGLQDQHIALAIGLLDTHPITMVK
jgi:hypothetical protein